MAEMLEVDGGEWGMNSADDEFDITSAPTWTAGRDFAIENGRNAGG